MKERFSDAIPSRRRLATTSVICIDKAGILALNGQVVAAAAAPFAVCESAAYMRQPNALLLSTAMALCNDGQAAEAPLADFVKPLGYDGEQMLKMMPRVDSIPFDLQRGRMTTVHKDGRGFRSFTKGCLESILAVCTHIQDGSPREMVQEDIIEIRGTAERMANAALHVQAFAMGQPQDTNYESRLVFLGLVGLLEPLAPGAEEAVAECVNAGIKPIMITDNSEAVAAAMAAHLGILQEGNRVMTGAELQTMDDSRLEKEVRHIAAYTCISKEDRLRIVRAWQAIGEEAIELAEGGSLVEQLEAISDSRLWLKKAFKAIRLLLTVHLAELLVFIFVPLLGGAAPLTLVRMLLIALCALAVATLKPDSEKGFPERPPRDFRAAILSKPFLLRTACEGVLMAAFAIAAYFIGGRAMAFAALIAALLIIAIIGKRMR